MSISGQYLFIQLLPLLFIFLAQLLIFGTMCRKLAQRKGYEGYFWTGAFLGIAGLVYVAGLPDLLLREKCAGMDGKDGV